MRILLLTPKLPWPLTGGAEIRNYSLLKETARLHEVCLLSFLVRPGDRDHFPALQPFCREIVGIDLRRPRLRKAANGLHSLFTDRPYVLFEFWRREMERAIRNLVERGRIDLVHVHNLHLAQYAAGIPQVAWAYDTHNLDHVLWQRFAAVQTNPAARQFARWQCAKFVRWQQIVGRCCDQVIALSETDAAEYRRICPEAAVAIVPNGADLDYFVPRDMAREPDTLLYFANFGWPPQDDAALYLHREILPLIWRKRPSVKLYLVGKTPPEAIRRLASERVIVTGYVNDIRDYLARATVVAIPLRVGAGTKHRVFQTLAMSKALVTTPVGAEGIALRHGENALIADNPQAFADCVLRLLAAPDERQRLGENGRRLVVDHHGWRANYAKLETVFQEAVTRHRHEGQ